MKKVIADGSVSTTTKADIVPSFGGKLSAFLRFERGNAYDCRALTSKKKYIRIEVKGIGIIRKYGSEEKAFIQG